MEPLHDYVLVEVEPQVPYHEYTHLSQIIVPDLYQYGPKDRAIIGMVLKKGPDCQEGEIEFQSRVVIGKGRGAYLNPSKTLMIVREPEILMVVQ